MRDGNNLTLSKTALTCDLAIDERLLESHLMLAGEGGHVRDTISRQSMQAALMKQDWRVCLTDGWQGNFLDTHRMKKMGVKIHHNIVKSQETILANFQPIMNTSQDEVMSISSRLVTRHRLILQAK
jgi:hypothetical protein